MFNIIVFTAALAIISTLTYKVGGLHYAVLVDLVVIAGLLFTLATRKNQGVRP